MKNNSFYDYILSKAERVYGNDLKNIKDRIAYEVERVEEMGISEELLIAEQLVRAYEHNQKEYLVKGSIGSLCISYALGITEVDPVKYNIPCEMALGIDGHKIPQFVIEHDGSGLFRIMDNPNLAKKRRALYSADINHEITRYDNLQVWNFFSEGNYPFDIGLDGEDTTEVLISIGPRSIEELAKAISIILSPGLFKGNAEILVKKGIIKIQDIPSTREDFLDLFIEHGIPREIAYLIIHYIRTGRKIAARFDDYITDAKLPIWLIPLCEKIMYLPTRVDSIQLSIIAYKTALADIN
jgi:DNA polymerase III alpha subunit (gram-positive type)